MRRLFCWIVGLLCWFFGHDWRLGGLPPHEKVVCARCKQDYLPWVRLADSHPMRAGLGPWWARRIRRVVRRVTYRIEGPPRAHRPAGFGVAPEPETPDESERQERVREAHALLRRTAQHDAASLAHEEGWDELFPEEKRP